MRKHCGCKVLYGEMRMERKTIIHQKRRSAVMSTYSLLIVAFHKKISSDETRCSSCLTVPDEDEAQRVDLPLSRTCIFSYYETAMSDANAPAFQSLPHRCSVAQSHAIRVCRCTSFGVDRLSDCHSNQLTCDTLMMERAFTLQIDPYHGVSIGVFNEHSLPPDFRNKFPQATDTWKTWTREQGCTVG